MFRIEISVVVFLAALGCSTQASDDEICAEIAKCHAHCSWDPKTKAVFAVTLRPSSDADRTISLCGKLSGLKSIRGDGMSLSKEGLTALSRLKTLEELGLDQDSVTDEDLMLVGNLKNLRSLDLTGRSITDDGLRHLSELNKLTMFSAQQTKITGKGLLHLAAAKDMEQLWLNQSPIDDDGLKAVSRFDSLVELYLANTNVSDIGLAHLLKLRKLERLLLTGSRVTRAGADVFQSQYKQELQQAFDRKEIGATDRIAKGVQIELWIRKAKAP